MPKYRLFYFNAHGAAETSRLLFAQAGVEYEDVRFESEQWPEYKPKTPFLQVPVLEVDGVQIADSNVIPRYLAKEFGMAGKTPLEQATVDMYAAAAVDLITPATKIFYAEDDKKEEMLKKYREEQSPKFLHRFEATLSSNKSGYLVGDEITWADLVLFCVITWDGLQLTDEMTKYPKVKDHSKRVSELPRIAAWLAKRPPTGHRTLIYVKKQR